MGRRKNSEPIEVVEPPSTTYDGREQQMGALATNLAERMLRDGSAPAAVIVHYLKLMTTRERLEQEKIRRENEMLEAKKMNLDAQRHSNELYQEALQMFKEYSGYQEDDGYDD